MAKAVYSVAIRPPLRAFSIYYVEAILAVGLDTLPASLEAIMNKIWWPLSLSALANGKGFFN
jgi:hypothetical protein